MTSSNIITPKAHAALSTAAKRFEETVADPCFLPGVNEFATAYLGEPDDNFGTRISGDAKFLSIAIQRLGTDMRSFVEVDLAPAEGEGALASIVKENKDDEAGHSIERPLTKPEALGLTMDILDIVRQIPHHRRKKNTTEERKFT